MRLDAGEEQEAQRWLQQAKQRTVAPFPPARKQPDEGGRRHGGQYPAKVAAEHHGVHPAALVVGGISVEIVGGEHLLYDKALAEIERAGESCGHQGGKGLPLLPVCQQRGEGGKAKGDGEEEKVPPQKEHQHQQHGREHAARALRTAAVRIDNEGPDARAGRRHIDETDEGRIEQHRRGAAKQQPAAAAAASQYEQPPESGEDVEIDRGEDEHIAVRAQQAHHERDGPGQKIVVFLRDRAAQHQAQLFDVQRLGGEHGAYVPVGGVVPVIDSGAAGAVPCGDDVGRQRQRQQGTAAAALDAAKFAQGGGGREHDGGEHDAASGGAGQPEGERAHSVFSNVKEVVADIKRRAEGKGGHSKQGRFPAAAKGQQPAVEEPQLYGQGQRRGGQQRRQRHQRRAGERAIEHGPEPYQCQARKAAPGDERRGGRGQTLFVHVRIPLQARGRASMLSVSHSARHGKHCRPGNEKPLIMRKRPPDPVNSQAAAAMRGHSCACFTFAVL